MREDSPVCSTIKAAHAEGLTGAALERRVWENHGITCAMLALDSSGMSRMTRTQGIVHFLDCFVQMRDAAHAILESHGCRRWRSFADNLFAEFPQPDAAVAAALSIHRTLRERRLRLTADEHYEVCIAIGYGRVLDNGDLGVLGDEMNITAKLGEDIARPGDTLLTASAYQGLSTHRPPTVEKIEVKLSTLAVTAYRIRP